MTIEFWPKHMLPPYPPRKPKRPPKHRKPRRPKQPVPVGKAQQMLSSAIILGDHELACWLDGAAVCGKPEAIDEFRKRLDSVMQPLA